LIMTETKRPPQLTTRGCQRHTQTCAQLGMMFLVWLCGSSAIAVPPADRGPATWVGTWAASMTSGPPDPPVLNNQTLRQIVHASVGGNRVRVLFSNMFGAQPLVIGAAHIATPLAGSIIRPGSDRMLTFGGRSSTSIRAGDSTRSDPIDFSVNPLGDLAISIYLPMATTTGTVHWISVQRAYVASGDRSAWTVIWPRLTLTGWFFLTSVEVLSPGSAEGIVALGDSLTEGDWSTPDANRRWPDVLAKRLLTREPSRRIAVLNAGIGGNRLLHDGVIPNRRTLGASVLGRFDRDVLAQPSVKYVIVLAGINDIIQAGPGDPEDVTPGEIIAGLQQLVDRAHIKRLLIFGGTLLPFEGLAAGLFSPESEAKRQRVNHWIRTSRAFDAVIDFDRAVRDPARPARLLPRYDCGDHLHPSDAGYEAMGNAIDLSLFSSAQDH
jgi:lysophospholipase L1-like esterase